MATNSESNRTASSTVSEVSRVTPGHGQLPATLEGIQQLFLFGAPHGGRSVDVPEPLARYLPILDRKDTPKKSQRGGQERGCIMSLVKRHSIITFFVLTYALTWGFLLIGIFGTTEPLVAALIVIPLTQDLSGLRELGSRMIRWRVRWFWYVVAIALPPAIVLVTVALNVALGASVPSLAGIGSTTTILMMFAVRLVNPGDGALGEEPGWRGVALPGLQRTLSPLVSTLILGVAVTVWHVPLLFMEDGLLQPSIIVGFLLVSFAVTFFYTWLFNHTGGSVLMTIVSHAA